MGKQPQSNPVFLWERKRTGHYVTSVDGIDYAITRLGTHRWQLTGDIGPARERTRLLDTIDQSYTSLRAYARRTHSARVGALNILANITPRPDATVIPDDVLIALKITGASFELSDEGNGWYARYSVKPPGRDWVRIIAFKPSAREALAYVGVQTRNALAPGGALFVEFDNCERL